MSDQPKESEEILKEQYASSIMEYRRSQSGLFLSAFTAGLEIGFSIVLMGLFYTTFVETVDKNALHLIVSLGYPLGFIFVIIGRSQLFTEQTSLAVIPFLKGVVNFSELMKLWGVVLMGNLIGGSLFAVFIAWIGPERDIISKEAFVEFAHVLTEPSWYVILGSAILAGWMMGLLGWLITTAQETISRVFMIVLVTFVIGYGKLHHCIVGTVELVGGYIHSVDPSLGDYGAALAFAILGNIIGGAFFVAGLKYSINEL
ncbi:formate/nitrite transporter family protein [Cryomorphaceae bacterium 1068]|nr:formate/nitrite transporter family protein [Cryomorphaceae bacterium 1068]